MFLNNSFGKTFDILHRSMDVSVLRHEVLANNMTNISTPDFKRSDITFESALKAALDSEKRKSGFQARMTDSRHIPFDVPVDYRTVKPKKTLDFLTTSKNNGNNVDPDVEANKVLHNQLQYQLMAQVLSSHYNQINLVLR
jgi:flagellar basal-body rod protein FlgB